VDVVINGKIIIVSTEHVLKVVIVDGFKKMTKQYVCRILSGDRITIPKPIFEELNLKVGDLLLKKMEGNKLIFVPAKLVERD